jgi:hypothetical protein
MKVLQPDPALPAENATEDEVDALRGYDRSAQATVSQHLWRGALPTGLDIGDHKVEVRELDRWQGEKHAETSYRLEDGAP